MATGDLKKMTKAELIRMAKAMKLDIKSNMLKGELVSLISRNATRGRTAVQKKSARAKKSASKTTRRGTRIAAGKTKGKAKKKTASAASAKKQAAEARKKGFNAGIFKKKKGWGVSVTRK